MWPGQAQKLGGKGSTDVCLIARSLWPLEQGKCPNWDGGGEELALRCVSVEAMRTYYSLLDCLPNMGLSFAALFEYHSNSNAPLGIPTFSFGHTTMILYEVASIFSSLKQSSDRAKHHCYLLQESFCELPKSQVTYPIQSLVPVSLILISHAG